MAYGLSNGHVTDFLILKSQNRDPNARLELETSNLVRSFVSGMPSGRTNNFFLKVGVAQVT